MVKCSSHSLWFLWVFLQSHYLIYLFIYFLFLLSVGKNPYTAKKIDGYSLWEQFLLWSNCLHCKQTKFKTSMCLIVLWSHWKKACDNSNESFPERGRSFKAETASPPTSAVFVSKLPSPDAGCYSMQQGLGEFSGDVGLFSPLNSRVQLLLSDLAIWLFISVFSFQGGKGLLHAKGRRLCFLLTAVQSCGQATRAP